MGSVPLLLIHNLLDVSVIRIWTTHAASGRTSGYRIGRKRGKLQGMNPLPSRAVCGEITVQRPAGHAGSLTDVPSLCYDIQCDEIQRQPYKTWPAKLVWRRLQHQSSSTARVPPPASLRQRERALSKPQRACTIGRMASRAA